MEATMILKKPQIILAGFSFFGDPFSVSAEWTEENEIGRLWQRFMTFTTKSSEAQRCFANAGIAYEVWIEHDDTAAKGHVEVFIGMEVEGPEDVPVELLLKVLPSAAYAVFCLKGQDITSDWNTAVQGWMAENDYENALPYGFQLYDQRFKGMDKIDESVIDAYVPVKRKNAASHQVFP